jgi:hypothetical protein
MMQINCFVVSGKIREQTLAMHYVPRNTHCTKASGITEESIDTFNESA